MKLMNKAAVGLTALSPVLAMAQVTATDIAPVVTAITAAIALIVLIGNAKLLVKVAVRTFSWLASSIR